jgi:hypothetical protein
MCSTRGERLRRVRVAIDALAAESGRRRAAASPDQAPADAASAPCPAGTGDPAGAGDDISGRLAELWAMLAELDPELARRLPRYLA